MDKVSLNPRQILKRAFPGMRESEAEEMVASGKVVTYPADTVLCQEGALEVVFYILLEGEVVVTKVINDAETRTLKFLHPGDFFGEMAIIHSAPRAATVTTTRETTVLEIYKEAFSSMLEHSSSMSQAMVKEVSRRLRENDEMAIEDMRVRARELALAYQQLAELERARSEFLTTIAHELRTPLMTANGFLQVIRMGMLQGEALNSALDTVGRNIQDIITLTNDILFLQEMDLILPAFQQVDIAAIVASVVEHRRNSAEQNKVGIRLNITSGIPPVLGDAKSLERAFDAVLDNAIKFSPNGGDVLVEVGHDHKEVWVQVEDHGVGIAPNVMPRIFDRFFHMDRIGEYLFRGVGLGLSIARQVLEQHHGRIEVESEVGQGSCFWIRMPKPAAKGGTGRLPALQ
jgi:signal transduction histidine kinase